MVTKELLCTLQTAGGNDVIPVTVTGGIGGLVAQQGSDVALLSDNVWSAIPPSGLNYPAGYFHLVTLQTSSLSATGCNPGSVALVNFMASDSAVS